MAWWSHLYDNQVSEETAERVIQAALNGMEYYFCMLVLGQSRQKSCLARIAT
ncbi:MAG: hypothetical protein HFI45_16285 [Lachnospiraceae bacterium]|nr:hypothetical protein [Lachnospiraceae bacterium]